MIAPAGLMLAGKVPWEEPVPAPGASNVTKVPAAFGPGGVVRRTAERLATGCGFRRSGRVYVRLLGGQRQAVKHLQGPDQQ